MSLSGDLPFGKSEILPDGLICRITSGRDDMKDCYTLPFASSHNASISSSEACSSELPRAARVFSM